jgi:hypothetical protein
VFDAAWRYEHGGLVRGIKEAASRPQGLLAGVARGWQYAAAMDRLAQRGWRSYFSFEVVLVAGELHCAGNLR